jgi:hypothetical protein
MEDSEHVVRMAKNIFKSKAENSRKVGRPTLRWLEDVENDLQELILERWKQKTNNREKKGICFKESQDC